jgi:hypothetical protein
VSIINRITGRHLDDAALAELWTSAAASPTDVLVHPHLEQCAECRVRMTAFSAWMDDLRTDAEMEAEAAFPSERLAAQQAQIFKRIEAAERPARVIVFPKFPARVTSQHSPVRQWIAASAAAGLLVGIGLGNIMDLRHLGEPRDARPTVIQPAPVPASRGVTPVAAVNEETLFQELEAAATPQYDALRPFDTFTPRAADVVRSSR